MKILASKGRAPLLWALPCIGLLMVTAAAGEPMFTDVTTDVWPAPLFASFASARGMAVGDVNNDGWPDIYLTKSGPPYTVCALLLNHQGQRFEERTELLDPGGSHAQEVKGGGSLLGDYDNDGDLDLVMALGSYGLPVADRILRNDRGLFTDATDPFMAAQALPTDNAVWLDYDRDGYLDRYAGHWLLRNFRANGEPGLCNALYRNNGDGTFSDATAGADLDVVFYPEDPPTERGGSAQGMIAGDFNGDGWPDLLMGVFSQPNRLFLNSEAGVFHSALSADAREASQTIGMAAGDIDNDGDLDVFHAAGGWPNLLGVKQERSQLLMNLGEGELLDVTEGVGLAELANMTTGGPYLADVDNDGDLDLLLGNSRFVSPERYLARLFLNDGNGMFVDATELFPVKAAYSYSLVDFDHDGFLDIVSGYQAGPGGGEGTAFRNSGNGNHWLQVELVGQESNRDGVGVLVHARSGDLVQARSLLGSDGSVMHEPIVQLGLGAHTQVDELEIRWPSGRVDHIANTPADQQIRVIEGRNEWYPAARTVWTVEPPADLTFGQLVEFLAECRPSLFEPTAEIIRITGDLSSLGGPEAVPLEAVGDGTYRLEASFTVSGVHERRGVEVFIEQETSLGDHWISLSRNTVVKGDPQVTAVTESQENTQPGQFALAQNHPNPFNPETTIRFSLSPSGEVELAVYSVTGQKVASPVSGVREAGEYVIRWGGTDDAGRQLGSGVYLYRLTSGDQVETRKLVLMR